MTQSSHSANKDSQFSYCTHKAIPDGSNLYYACLFEKQKSRQHIIGLHALLTELAEVLFECSDPGVAIIKYQWWQEELQRLTKEEARHPVSKFLQQMRLPVNLEQLRHAAAAFEPLIQLDQPQTMEESLALFKLSAGKIWRECASLNGIDDSNILQLIESMGADYHFLQSLQQPGTYITDSRCILPIEIISLKNLFNMENKNCFKELLNDLIERMETSHQQFDKTYHRQFRHGLILNQIGLVTAREILKNDCQLLTMRVSLTPIRKLLLAWWTNIKLD